MKKRLFSLFCLLGGLPGLLRWYGLLFSVSCDSQDGLHDTDYSLDGADADSPNHGKSFARWSGRDRLMRDPSICQAPDGTFHMVWTSVGQMDYRLRLFSRFNPLEWAAFYSVMMRNLLHIIAGHLGIFTVNLRKLIIFLKQRPFPGRHKEVPVVESEKEAE